MNLKQFDTLIKQIQACNDYLDGKVHPPEIVEVAKLGAQQAVAGHRSVLMDQLKNAGLDLEEFND